MGDSCKECKEFANASGLFFSSSACARLASEMTEQSEKMTANTLETCGVSWSKHLYCWDTGQLFAAMLTLAFGDSRAWMVFGRCIAAKCRTSMTLPLCARSSLRLVTRSMLGCLQAVLPWHFPYPAGGCSLTQTGKNQPDLLCTTPHASKNEKRVKMHSEIP